MCTRTEKAVGMIGAAVTLALLVLSGFASQPQLATDHSEAHAQEQGKQPPSDNAARQCVPQNSNAPAPAAEYQDKEPRGFYSAYLWTQKIVAGCSIAAAVISGFALLFLRWTYKETEKTAKAAIDSAKAAVWAIESQRAWICFEDTFVNNFFNSMCDGIFIDHGFFVSAKWTNKSQTPAIGAKTFIGIKVIDIKDESIHKFKTTFDKTNSSASIGPNNWVYTEKRFTTAQEADDIASNKSAIFVYSEVRYFDIFDKDTVRVSKINLKIICNGQRVRNGIAEPLWERWLISEENSVT